MTDCDQVVLSARLLARRSDPVLGAARRHSPPRRPRRWEPYGFIGESMIEDAWIADWKGGRYVCPRRPHLRCWKVCLRSLTISKFSAKR